MFDIDWHGVIAPSGSVAEILLRGTLVYLAIFAALRLLPRRTVGSMGPSDILVMVLIADAVQNAMSNGYESVTEGLALAGVIFAWATLIDRLDYRFPQLHLGSPAPRELIRDGEILWRNLEREQLSEHELRAALREQGLESTRDVVAAWLEGDGQFSVLRRDRKPMRRMEKAVP